LSVLARVKPILPVGTDLIVARTTPDPVADPSRA
jgi:hypothetical protein